MAHIGSPSLKEGLPSTFSLGAMVKLSSSATCAGSAAVRRWRVTSRPELSSLQVTGSQAAHVDIDLRPDLPGVYRVELTVVTARGESMASLEFEVEGELTWPGARDAGLDHGGSSGDGLQDGPAPPADGGCGGCAAVHGSDTSAWILIGALLLLIRRRGQRI